MKNLYQIFIHYLKTFIVITTIITAVIYFIPIHLTFSYLKDKNHQQAVHYKANLLNYYISNLSDNIRALASRTMIRKKMYQYHIGKLPLSVLMRFTRPKYEDGCNIYENLLAARRTDTKGNTIALFGDADILETIEPVNKQILITIRENSTILTIRNEIKHNGRLIGYDTGAFSLDKNLTPDKNYIHHFTIAEKNPAKKQPGMHIHSADIGDTGYILSGFFKYDYYYPGYVYTILISLLFIGVLSGALMFISYRTIYLEGKQVIARYTSLNRILKEKQDSLINVLGQKEILIKEVNHRVKNNLTMLNSIINLMCAKSCEENTRNIFTDLMARIETIMLIHQNLYTEEDVRKINLRKYISQLSERIIGSMSTGQIDYTIVCDDITVPTDRAISIGLITAELLTNALKYGFRGTDEKKLHVSIERENDKMVLKIFNTGVPIEKDISFEEISSLGMNIVHKLVKQLKGDTYIERIGGTAFVVSCPIENKN